MAERIAAFVRDNFHSINTLIVHCKYGQSRSAGVAKAIAKQHRLAFPEGYTYANNYVYERLLNSLRLQGEA